MSTCGIRYFGIALAFLALLSANGPLHAQETDLRGGIITRQAVGVNTTTGDAYVVDADRGAVTVLKAGVREAMSVKVGDGPIALAVNSTTNRIYVVNHDGGTVSVLDGVTDKVLATVSVGSVPFSIVVDEKRNTIYVSNVYSNMLKTIDGVTNAVTETKAIAADAMVGDSARNKVYLMSYESSVLSVLDGATGSVSHISAGKMHLWREALDGAADTLYVTRIGDKDAVALDEHSHQMTVIPTGSFPCSVAINARTHTAYVVNYGDDSLTVIDTLQEKPIATVKVGERPEAVAVDEVANVAYVVNTMGNSVSVIDGRTHAVVATLPAGKHPYALSVNAKKGELVVANFGEPSFTRLDLRGLHKQEVALSTQPIAP